MRDCSEPVWDLRTISIFLRLFPVDSIMGGEGKTGAGTICCKDWWIEWRPTGWCTAWGGYNLLSRAAASCGLKLLTLQ